MEKSWLNNVTALQENQNCDDLNIKQKMSIASVLYKLSQYPLMRLAFILQAVGLTFVALLGIVQIKPNSDVTKLMPDKKSIPRLHGKQLTSSTGSKGFCSSSWSMGHTTQTTLKCADLWTLWETLESLPFAVGPTSTNLWLREFDGLFGGIRCVKREGQPGCAMVRDSCT